MAFLAVGVLVFLLGLADTLVPVSGMSLLPLGGIVGNVVGILWARKKGKVYTRTNEPGHLSEKLVRR